MENGTFDDDVAPNLERRVGGVCTHPTPKRIYLQPSIDSPPLVMGTCATCYSDYHVGNKEARLHYNDMYRAAIKQYIKMIGEEHK